MTRAVFDAHGQSILDLAGEFLVHCPRCSHCASVTVQSGQRFGPVRLLCVACGHLKDKDARQLVIREAVDWYFGLPLWLQTPCHGRVLWAYNLRHLTFLEAYVRAGLRQDARGEGSLRNGTLASRLPAWIKSAKNRDDVLCGLSRLHELLGTREL